MTPAFERFLDAVTATTGLTPRGTDRTRTARCPAHDDSTPSLSVTRGTDRVLVRCQAGCDTDDVLAALSMTRADLFDEAKANGHKPVEVATYDYIDEPGTLLYQVVRLSPKGFRQRRPDGHGGWKWNLNGARRVLYNLPTVNNAVRDSIPVFVTEGEKDADALTTAGEVATCNPGGAGKWRPEFSKVLAGAVVVIVADRDAAGHDHAEQVRAALAGVARSVVVVEAAEGKDAADHLAAGHTVDEFRPVSSGPDKVEQVDTAAKYVDWSALWADEREGTEWLVEPLIEAGQSIALYSPAKVGKSLLALEAAAAKATGRAVLGNAVGEPIHVLYVDHENTADDLRDRLADFGYGPTDDLSRLHYSLLADWPALDTEAGGRELHEAATACGARLVILDTVSRAISGEENSADTFLALYRHTIRRLKRDRIAFWRLDHTGKDVTKGQRGSSAKRDDVDAVWSLLPRGGDSLTLRREASRTGQGPEMLMLRRLAGPLRHVVDRFDDAHERDVLRIVDMLDSLEVPSAAGRPTAAKALRDHGDSARNSTVAEAVRRRAARVPAPVPDLSPHARGQRGDSGDSPGRGKSPSTCPLPPLYRRGQGDSPDPKAESDPVALVTAQLGGVVIEKPGDLR